MNQEFLLKNIDQALQPAAEKVLDLILQSIRASRSLTVELSPPVIESGDLSAAVSWLAGWMEENHGFKVKMQAEEAIAIERTDIAVLLFKSIRELLLNVLKHAGVKTAEIEMTRERGELRIVVSDSGRGCDSESLWNQSESFAHFGLLSIRERLQHMGGRFVFESRPGGGSTALLTIPLDVKDAAEKPWADSSGNVQATSASAAGLSDKIRMVIADDHPDICKGLSVLFGLQPDIEVTAAAPVKKAIQLIRETVPDVVLLDFRIPASESLETVRIIHSEFPHIRVIGQSVYDSHSHVSAIINAGVSAYWCKYDDFDLLLRVIRGESRGSEY